MADRSFLAYLILFFCCTGAFVNASDWKSYNGEDENNDITIEDEERLLIIPAITFNASSISSALPLALALATSLASLLATVALAAVVFSLFGKYKLDGYGGGGYGGSGGAYTSYSSQPSYRSFLDPSIIDWERVSILDLLSVGEEIWSTFNPSDPNCQKRLICDIHQNVASLGPTAQRFVNLFGYLTYAKIATLPKELDTIVDDYLDAADKGIISTEDCGNIFPDCKFSLKKIATKYSPNQI